MSQQIASIYADLSVKTNGANQELKNFRNEVKSTGDSLDLARQKTAILGTVFTATVSLIASSYSTYSKLTESVRDLSLVSGESAESTSRFIQVLDDFQLTAEDATSAARFLKEKGLTPNVETLAKLSDEFKKIQDPAERMAFVQENLGRGGARWVNVLNQGGDALRKLSGEVSKNLIISEQQIRMYETQRLAIDNVMDSVEGFKVQLGQNTANVLSYMQALSRANQILKEQGLHTTVGKERQEAFNDALNQAVSEQLSAADASIKYSDSLAEQEAASQLAADAAAELSNNLSGMIGLIDNMQSAEESYTEKSKDLSKQRSDAEAELALLRAQGYWEYGEQIQNALGNIEDIKTAEAKLEAERERQTLQFVSNILAENLARDGWTQSEFDAFAKQQEAWGLWSADVVSKAQAAWMEADKITASINNIPTEKTVNINVVQNGLIDISNSGNTAPVGIRRQSHASGGSFVIPQSYGNEGFMLGNGDTASGGEPIKISPRGTTGNEDVVAAIMSLSSNFNPNNIARIFSEEMMKRDR